jgi:hypothetical protein
MLFNVLQGGQRMIELPKLTNMMRALKNLISTPNPQQQPLHTPLGAQQRLPEWMVDANPPIACGQMRTSKMPLIVVISNHSIL